MDYIIASSTGLGVRLRRKYDDQDLHIAEGVVIASDDNSAISVSASYHDVTVAGQVRGAIYGIVLGNDMLLDIGNKVTIEATGYVDATIDAVRFKSAQGTLVNWGQIHAGATSSSDGVVLGGVSGGASVIVNRGSIWATDQGIEVNDGTTETVVLENHGSLTGIDDAYVGDENVDRIVNHGTIQGEMHLRGGADVYDGREGTLLSGSVLGGEGDDLFLPGAGAETLNGGNGFDTLDLRDTAGQRVSLSDTSGTGVAAGDSYRNMERVLGSETGADAILGNSAGNVLHGFGGQDSLRGNGGNDLILGGAERDTLTGSSGDDVFVFASLEEAGDWVTDFAGALGNDDAIRLVASGFGGGLVAGGTVEAWAFQTRGDNLAQDADDRFVFRTTDRTLWFDADGSGALEASLVADLQSSAVVTAADILLV